MMTRDRVFGEDKPFCEWMRNHELLPSNADKTGFVATDCDLIVHRFKREVLSGFGSKQFQGLMHVEAKTRSSVPRSSQIDTLAKLNETSRCHLNIDGMEVRNFGVFVLSMSGLTPEDSCEMRWGVFPDIGRKKKRFGIAKTAADLKWIPITTDALIRVLLFDLHPRNLVDRPFRNHHKETVCVEEVTTPLGFQVEKQIVRKS